MRRRLRAEADELRQLRQALTQRSPLHVLLHSELEPSGEDPPPAVAGRLLSADGVLAGDWYDAFALDRERFGVVVVDTAGHGPEAGLFALRIKYLISPALRSGLPPGDALGWVAAECGEREEQFATGIVLEIDPVTRCCRYANAGHPSGLLFRRDRVEELAPTGPLMGALPGSSWRTESVVLEPGDLVVLVTDGVLEARLPDGAEFGSERVAEAVRRAAPQASPDDVAEAVMSAVRDACVAPLRDDATVTVVRLDAGV
jgi:serine phosphatase RsbU (regulator of sigma subunit)